MSFANKLSTWARARGHDLSCILTPRHWIFVVVAALLAIGVAEHAYLQLDIPQRYSQFMVGSLAWDHANKFHDYAVPYVLVLAFVVLLVIVATIVARIKDVFGEEGVMSLHRALALCCAPAGLWLGQLITTKIHSLLLVHAAQVLVLAALLFAVAMARRGAGFWRDAGPSPFETLSTFMMFFAMSALVVPAIGVAVDRLGGSLHGAYIMASEDVLAWTWGALACAAALVILSCLRARDPRHLDRRSRQLAMGAQWFMPLFFLCLIPPSWTGEPAGALDGDYALSALALAVILGIVSWSCLRLYTRTRAAVRPDARLDSPLDMLTLGCMVAVLLFLKMSPLGLASVPYDDYHFGEMLVPWWSWMDQGMLPFWDYAPARGMINYVPGLLAGLVFNGNPASFAGTYAFFFVPAMAVVLSVIRRTVGTGPAIIACLLGPSVNGYGEIDLATAAFLAYLCWGYFHWNTQQWLTRLLLLGTLLLLYAPGQGALTLVACTPMALSQLMRLSPRKSRPLGLLLVAAALLLACLVTPLGKMLLGALRYGAEQSSINSIAHGISWSSSFDLAPGNAWLFEVMRGLWIAVAALAAVLLVKAWAAEKTPERTRILVYAGAILIVLLLFVVRAAGRIGPGPSRLGLASSWAVLVLAPLLFFLVAKARAIPVLAWVTAAGLIAPFHGGMALDTLANNYPPGNADAFNPNSTVRVHADSGLGTAIIDRAQMERIGMTRKVLDSILQPDETYLDMSTRHALYYYVNRRPPIESGALYNLIDEAQQLRAIASLRALRLPAILLDNDNIMHDGGPSSLRSNLVYREVLLSDAYKLAATGRQTWLIRKDRLPRWPAWAGATVLEVDASITGPLMKIFHAPDLKSIPASWGRSFETLRESAQKVLDIQPEDLVALHDVKRNELGHLVIDGPDPFVRFDFSAAKIRGRDAGLLSFDFLCHSSKDTQPGLALYWTSEDLVERPATAFTLAGHPGRLVVPVDSSPAWLLSPQIRTIRIDVESELTACREFSISDLQLWRRKAATSAN